MITQSEIARLAGVSRSTVERVINNHGEVRAETRARILKILKEHDYRPNRGGRSLAIRQKNLKIGCILIDADNPFYAELNKGIQMQAQELQLSGIQVIVSHSRFQVDSIIKKIDELLACEINALVLQPIADPRMADKLRDLEHLNIPIVTVNTDLPDYDGYFCYVGNDFRLCGKTVANLLHLITGGHCCAGIVTGFQNARSHSDRVEGFLEYIRNVPGMQAVAVAENYDDETKSFEVVKAMLEEHPEIDSLIVVAGGVYGAGRAVKLVMKEQHRSIHVLTFDDLENTKQLVREGIIQATICQQPIRQGKTALSVLLDYFMDGIKPENRRLYTDLQIKLQANIDA